MNLTKRIARTYRAFGAPGVINAVLLHLPLIGTAARWWLADHPWIGGLVENRGNLVSLDGCVFSVESPAISLGMKSRFPLNRYEREERLAIRRFLDPRLPVVELGGSIGVLACITNKQLVNPARHVVIEANPDLLPLLENNRSRNRCHFVILHRAIAYHGATASFHPNDNFVCGSVQGKSGRSVPVPASRLREVLDEHGFESCTLISDIEGGETDMVELDGPALAARVATLIIEIHPLATGEDRTAAMLRRLADLGFRLAWKKRSVHVYLNGQAGSGVEGP